LESIKSRSSNVAKPFVIGACTEDSGAVGGQDGEDFEDEVEANQRKPRKSKKSKSKKKKRKTKALRAADAPKPLGSDVAKSHASSKCGPNYEPKKYMASYKAFLAEKKLEGLNRAEALEGWHSSDIKKKLLEGMSYSEMKRRRFIRGG
jgi:hypothetical protein